MRGKRSVRSTRCLPIMHANPDGGRGDCQADAYHTPGVSGGTWFRFASYRLDSDELGRLPIHEGFLLRMAIDVEIAHHASNGMCTTVHVEGFHTEQHIDASVAFKRSHIMN